MYEANDSAAAEAAGADLLADWDSYDTVLIGYPKMESYVAHPEMEFKLRKENLGFADADILRQATIDSAILQSS